MYQTLYRKYRPKKFSDVVGQDVITTVLKNSIKNGKIAHAYLFIGPRGTGKTSTAKIFSRAVNCTNNDNGDLCDNCEMCNVSRNKDCLDIIEIDAASNNGVDEIRNLREKVSLVPSELKYKVYIIDEVHMLTIQAFNALLKTLEEPPEHIIFILATTDPQKVPETIVSRCQTFNFNRISEDNIAKNLKMISENEHIDIDDEVLNQIAIMSDGGMRDSIGMLDKLASYADKKIVVEDFLKINGLVSNDDIEKIIGYVKTNNVVEVISLLEKWNNDGNNLIQIIIQLLNYLKNIIVENYIKGSLDSELQVFQKLANLLNEKLSEIKKSSNPRIYIEIILLDFMNENFEKTQKIISREIISEKKVENQSVEKDLKEESIEEENKNVKKQLKSNVDEVMKIRINNAFVGATKDILNDMKKKFEKLNDYTFDTDIGYLVCNLLDGNLRMASNQYLVISYEYPSIVADNLLNIVDMENIIHDILNISIKLVIISDSMWEENTKKFIENKKNNITYDYINEPELMFDKSDDNEKKMINNGNLEEFSDILEIE